ncbi:DNA repair protein RecO [Lactobacillus sp. DCY120]|uniref:DNA repair protein RecO n=1 Tax=Bombilactobacillus apium TaxID=2675299 RepID=A0A850QYN6_9LACO|nr:DNA repair protein RecO [Bombilactobacillus apium]NVY95839.1 DNA repair protein RecO [Bombilactobacillus apium]
MTLQRHQEFQGLVLRTQDYHENDQLVYLFTDRFGILTFLLRGTKKLTSKKRALGLIFTTGTYQGTLNDRGFSYLESAQNLHQFAKISQDITKNAYVTYLNDLVLRSLTAKRAYPRWFHQILTATQLIDQGLDPEIITDIIAVQLLQPLGVAPQWQHCVLGPETTGKFDFSLVYSGILCQKHWSQDEHRLHLDPKTVTYLRLFSRLALDRVHSIKVTSATKVQLRQILDLIYRDHVGIYPRSKKFLDSMYKWQLDS